MQELELFTSALNLTSPWYVSQVKIEEPLGKKELHIWIEHTAGVKFAYEGEDCPVYDHQARTWKHLDFFEHECYLHASVPRVKLSNGKVRLVAVPWAEAGSSFTLLFCIKVMRLVQGGMSIPKAGQEMRISAKRVFRLIDSEVAHALATQALAPVRELSIDETSSRKGHNYLTILGDREAKKVVGISVGKDIEAVSNALVDMEVRGADKEQVKAITMDMSKSYISSANQFLPQAEIIFDRFHIVKKMNEAVDHIRKEEQRNYGELKKSRWLWLKNQSRLTDEQQEQLAYLAQAYPTIGTAHRLKELLKQVLDDAYHDHRLRPINDWIQQAWNSGLEPIQKFVNMLHEHWYGVSTYFKRLATNAFAERINLKIQEIKRIAKGYRNLNNFKTMIYFHLGKLDLGITH